MELLLDTHVLLWALLEPKRLSAPVAAALSSGDNRVFASAVSAWEIALKQSIGKLTLPGDAAAWLPSAVERTGFEWLPISPADGLAVGALPWHHRDPFDRLLVAQTRDGRRLVTHDRALGAYAVPVMWV